MTTYPHLSAALPQLATPAEVADYLHRAEAVVVRDCRKGWLKPAAVKVGGRWYVKVDELARLLANPSSSAHPVHDASTGSQGGPPPGVVPVGSPPSADGDPGGPGARSRRERSRA